MARTKILFGHKQLVGEVVRDRRREAGGQMFERRWPQSACFSREKTCDLCGCWVGPLLVLKYFSWKPHQCRFKRTGRLPVCHCRFKIRQWRRILNRQLCCFLGSVFLIVKKQHVSTYYPTLKSLLSLEHRSESVLFSTS
jgi:hypothetical protein